MFVTVLKQRPCIVKRSNSGEDKVHKPALPAPDPCFLACLIFSSLSREIRVTSSFFPLFSSVSQGAPLMTFSLGSESHGVSLETLRLLGGESQGASSDALGLFLSASPRLSAGDLPVGVPLSFSSCQGASLPFSSDVSQGASLLVLLLRSSAPVASMSFFFLASRILASRSGVMRVTPASASGRAPAAALGGAPSPGPGPALPPPAARRCLAALIAASASGVISVTPPANRSDCKVLAPSGNDSPILPSSLAFLLCVDKKYR